MTQGGDENYFGKQFDIQYHPGHFHHAWKRILTFIIYMKFSISHTPPSTDSRL